MASNAFDRKLKDVDPEISEILRLELKREREKLDLIASENYASPAILDAQGSIFTNKYAEGYPYHRYYSGCEYADRVEELAVSRLNELYGSEYSNVQPHAGSQANMAVYMVALEPGDTMLAMDLRCGGHLTHGSPANFSGKLYNVIHYGVNRETGLIDYENVARIAEATRPKLIVAGASAYPRKLDFKAFREIADSVGASLMVDMAHFAGLVAGGVHPDPVPYSEFVTGTTHKTLRGPRGGFILAKESFGERLNSSIFPGTQGGPLVHAIAAKAVCFHEAMKQEFKEYQRTIVENSKALCEKIASEGFRIVSGGTETHLFLIDLRDNGISGKNASLMLESINICLNMNEIPYDPQPPTVTSGIRIGTPSVTTRGMEPGDMDTLGGIIARALRNPDNGPVLAELKSQVLELAEAFPIYPDLD
ncbi:MAG: serine hydroxymethyltransferase [Actinobacteria bacterium]|nr:serine hydroxymethyltransferase [Actinomycetota bacterium]